MTRSSARMIRLVILLVIFGLFSFSGLETAAAENEKRVELSDRNWLVKSPDSTEPRAATALREAVVAWQDAWIRRDLEACKKMLTDNAMLVSQIQAGILSGREAVLAGLPREWAEYETDDNGSSAITCKLLRVNGEIIGNAAMVYYYVQASGGNLWNYDDTGAFVQIFVRRSAGDHWRLAFGSGDWGLDHTLESLEPTFAFDYGLPVKDLTRAVKFYQPLLGEPEAQVDNIAVFEVKGSRLYLVAKEMDKLAPLRSGQPNGWVILTPPEFDRARNEAIRQGVNFTGPEQEFADLKVIYGYEPGGNLVALARPVQKKTVSTQPVLNEEEAVSGDPLTSSVAASDKALHMAWVQRDAEGYLKNCLPEAVVLDGSRDRLRGWTNDKERLHSIVYRDFENRERNPKKRAASNFSAITFKDTMSRAFGPWQIITRRRITRGAEPWKRRQESIECCIYSLESGHLALSQTLPAGRQLGLAIQFDYSGMPVTEDSWKKTDRACRALTGGALTGGADTYKDEGWKGFWGERAVMGIFLADPEADGMPRHHEASTYLSMDISKAETALKYAKDAGSTFPEIPAINSGKAGLNRLRGYNQVYLTDSEGNGIVLTEYTGRSRRQSSKDDDNEDD